MNKVKISILIISLFAGMEVYSQTTEAKKSLPQGLGMFVFPAKDQDAATQEKDEYDCYKWAIEQTGYNPLNPPEIEAEQVPAGPTGGAVRGAAGGAAAGAAIGAIAGDAGKGAAIGATAGAIRGRRAGKYAQAKQQQANNQAAEQESKDLETNFKKAYTACLTGKGYTVQ